MLRHEPDAAAPQPLAASPAIVAAPPPIVPAPRRGAGRWRLANILLCALVLLLGVTLVWLLIAAPPSRSARPIVPPTVTLLAADGGMIARRGAVIGRPVDVHELPPHVAQAFIAVEDRRFYAHSGIDPHGIARAAWADLRAGAAREGGSTITQQLAKLVYLHSDRTLVRKAQEAAIALWLETWLSKDEILSRYLSNVYFGDNVYGLRAAARHYFGKAPEQLGVGEAALLAGLMKAPSRLAPTQNLAGAQARARLVIAAMQDAGFLGHAEAARAKPARLRLRPTPKITSSTYFADWVLPAVREQTADSYEPEAVHTTLDARLQRLAERSIARAGVAGAETALIAMRPDGRVVAMVGGRNYKESSFNRAVQARRQPGSTFKLFVYLAALRAGMTPDSKIEDRPISIDGWTPKNSDKTYRGTITLRQAFARSSNMAAIRLTQQVGPKAVARTARDLGIASPLAVEPSIALGTSGVSLLELTSAYAAVAGGRYPVRAYGLPDQQPEVKGALLSWQKQLTGRERDMLLDLLSATVKTGTGRGAALTKQVFGKTGTSQEGRDALFVGFADGLVTAVWVGRDDNKPLKGIAGGGPPARIWRSFMADAIGARPLGAKVPTNVDPDADLDIGALLDRLKIGVSLDDHGLHIEPELKDALAPPPEEATAGDDER